MSAWIVSDKCINCILSVLDPPFDVGTMKIIGQRLVDTNYASVNYRYSEHQKPHGFAYQVPAKPYSPIVIIKQCHCYGYQSCEHPEWEDSWERICIEMLERMAVAKLPKEVKDEAVYMSKEYDDAPWGL
jgi:hypothetical protein